MLAGGLLGPAAPAAAAAGPTASPVPPAALTLQVTGDGSTGPLRLLATLRRPGGTPLAGATVTFAVLSTEFGPKPVAVPLGVATTDQAGRATARYLPTWTGPQRYLAGYQGGQGIGPAQAGASVTVAVAQSAYVAPPPKPLRTVGVATVVVLLIVVTVVWLTLLAQLARVRRVTRTG